MTEKWLDGVHSFNNINYSVLNDKGETLRVSRETMKKLVDTMEKPAYIVYNKESLRPNAICSTIEKAEEYIGPFVAKYNIEAWGIDTFPPLEVHGLYVVANLANGGQIIECTPYHSVIHWNILVDNFTISQKTIKPHPNVEETDKILIMSLRVKTVEEAYSEVTKIRNAILQKFGEMGDIPNGMYSRETFKLIKNNDTMGAIQ